jgi:hypothetical protein
MGWWANAFVEPRSRRDERRLTHISLTDPSGD